MIGFIPFFIVFALLVSFVVFFPFSGRRKKFGLFLLAGLLILEFAVFNFDSASTLFNEPEKLEGAEGSVKTSSELRTAQVVIKDLNKKIGNIKLDVKLSEKGEKRRFSDGEIVYDRGDYAKYVVYATDETQSNSYRTVSEGYVIRGDEGSNYIKTNLSGECKSLKITLTSPGKTYADINGITINEKIPFDFSPVRLVLLFTLVFFTNILFTSKKLKKGFEENKTLAKKATALACVLFVLLSAVYILAYNKNSTDSYFSKYDSQTGNQISKELVDSFEKGQVSLLDEPPKELLEMENPYDWDARSTATKKGGWSYKWDHLLYNGKYYSYYGIAPVVLLFLPYHLLTGSYFPTPASVLLFGCAGLVFLCLLFYEFTKRFMPKTRLTVYISSLLLIGFSCELWYCFVSPLFYEIAQTSAFCFTTLAFYLLIKANVFTDKKINLVCLAFSTVCFSLAVMCRPTTAVYSVCAVLIIIIDLVRRRKSDGFSKAFAAKYLVCAFAGFFILGSLQMWYNYARFGSFTDFGIQYSLTINDFTRSEFHADLTYIAFFNYLFAFPRIYAEFPFIFPNYQGLGVSGYYFVASTSAVGIFFRALPALGYIFLPAYIKRSSKTERKTVLPVLLSVCVLCPLIIMFSIWESGYGTRYAADFSWEMLIGAYYIIYKVKGDKTSDGFFALSAAYGGYISVCLALSYFKITGYLQSVYMSLERVFEFWK